MNGRGEDYDGTSVLAGAKILTRTGQYKSFAWTKSAADLSVVVSRKGPCVLGLNMYEGMMAPDPWGYLRPEGNIVGGHAILCKGYSVKTQSFIVHNSWGSGWGLKGSAYIRFFDMQRLLNEDGEACLPLRNSFSKEVKW
jgi:C1A family cysteine protease